MKDDDQRPSLFLSGMRRAFKKPVTFEERADFMKQLGVGGSCLVDGRVNTLVRFDEAARMYEFTNEKGLWTVGDEAFSKGLHDLKKLGEE